MTEYELERQRKYRKRTNDIGTKKYEKTKKGFLLRLYRNMKSRITGVQKAKFYLYEGKELLTKEEFYNWAFSNETFHKLYEVYESSNYERKLAPGVDRVNSSRGYTLDNMEIVTLSENCKRSNIKKT